jgi:hypothetical protein
MSEVAELRQEVAELRQEVAELREDTAQARAVAAFADRDAASIRVGQAGIVATLNALRETQVEQGRVLGEHGRVLGALIEMQQQQTEVLARHTAALDGLTASVGALADGQEEQAGTLAEILRRLPG